MRRSATLAAQALNAHSPHSNTPIKDAEQDTTAMLRRYVHSALSSKSKGSSNEAYARCVVCALVCVCLWGDDDVQQCTI